MTEKVNRPFPGPARVQCSECSGNYSYPGKDIFAVDEDYLCINCLFGDIQPVRFYPIGYVCEVEAKSEPDRSSKDLKQEISKIELLPSQKRFMYKLEEERALTIVYHLHQSGPIRSRFRRKLDGKEVGVFASHTPHRLSLIGIQDVSLLQIEGTQLTVKGLDAFQGTPVLDIKSAGPHLCVRDRST